MEASGLERLEERRRERERGEKAREHTREDKKKDGVKKSGGKENTQNKPETARWQQTCTTKTGLYDVLFIGRLDE